MKTNKPGDGSVPGATNDENKRPSQKPAEERWARACTDLKHALSTWDDLSKAPQGLSKDEQQLEEVKQLLKGLAKQVAELS